MFLQLRQHRERRWRPHRSHLPSGVRQRSWRGANGRASNTSSSTNSRTASSLSAGWCPGPWHRVQPRPPPSGPRRTSVSRNIGCRCATGTMDVAPDSAGRATGDARKSFQPQAEHTVVLVSPGSPNRKTTGFIRQHVRSRSNLEIAIAGQLPGRLTQISKLSITTSLRSAIRVVRHKRRILSLPLAGFQKT